MKALLPSMLLGIGLGLAVPQVGQAQSYDRDSNSITIPAPNWFGNGGRQQQAELPDRDSRGYCSNLRRQARDAGYRVDNAQYREDRERAEDRLRRIDDQLWRDCN
jgi:hypothetical protein